MKTYKDYTNSRIEWIGNVPEHWSIKKLSLIFNFTTGFTPPTSNSEFYDDGDIDWVTIADMKGKYISSSQSKITLIATEGKQIIPKGALMYSFKLSVGKVAFAQKDIYTNEAIFSIFPDESLCLDYYYYLLPHVLIFNANENIYGAKILNQEIIKASKLVVPPLCEQRSIANFLNYKATQIDKLISDKEDLIEFLNEERIAIINRAVTKGIETAIPKKYSGIDWLGEIPEHWSTVKIKYVSVIKYGLGQPPKQKEGGLKIIRATNVFRGVIKEDNMVYVDPDDIPWNRDPVLKEDDIIIVRSGAYTGDSAIITKDYAGSITGYDIVVTAKKVHAQFLAYALLSTYLLDNQLFLERLRAAQPHLNAEEIGNCFLIEPPMSEQINIVNYIKNEHIKIDELIEKVKHEVILLKEYKIALISEVVTGKVDVRDEIISESLATT